MPSWNVPVPTSVRSMVRLLLVALALTLLPGTPTASAALGGSGAFGELTQGGQETTTTNTATTTTKTATTASTTETTNSGSTILLAAGAAMLLLAGIAFVIIRDARRVAPAGEADVTEVRSARDPAAAMRKRRAKAKAARRQRKRNR